MNPDQTAPKEQSDLGPYCLQYILPKYTEADKFCLFVSFDSLRPINNISVKQGRVFLD